MELIIREKNATICLNMIVKNESHIIENTLEKLCKKINFDYWVICDTGSTDNTPQIITNFFEKMDIKGELYYDEWTDFAHNRTLALERAYGKTDLLLIFDADDEIVGNVIMPTEVLYDDYLMKFGSELGTSYTRVLLINNHKKYKFLSVIHEFITCIDGPTSSTIISGDYYVVSGRSGSRSMDPNKYLKDALILEKAHAEALKNNDNLFHRYSYYCGNSYKDCGRFEDAIKWYKITLSQENQWDQEKYTSCLYIYDCYKALNQETNGYFYLVKSFSYDKERVECLYPLLVHYCCENIHQIAYSYYTIVKDFFENRYLNSDMSRKLFTVPDKYNFFVPYYMILIADKVQDFTCVIRMYEIIFIKKQPMVEEWYIKNLLYNLHFFLQHIPKDNTHFIALANDYINFLFINGVKLQSFDFLTKDEYTKYGININNYIITKATVKPQRFSKDECVNSKNILIYTGFSNIEWNYTYMLNNALGGSEKAVAYISNCFPKDFNIFISGHVKNETIDNIQYIHLDQLTNLIERTPFHTLIVSRYIGFYEMFQTCSFFQSFIWAHDILLLPYGCNLNENQILKKWNNYINGCICLTEWHKALFLDKYPELNNKITLINNGLDLESFSNIDTNNKIKNKFIYSSRPDRGLNVLLKLWPQIIEKIPDATLVISTYGSFPSNPEELLMKTVIDSTPSIHYLGKLNVEQLYNEMSTSEFWLYPTHWPETSCITALEMLMSEVICLYYPVAGLPFTMDKYGIQIKPGSEIEAIVSLTVAKKRCLRKNGREYAETCSWENRFTNWLSVLGLNKKKWYFYCSPNFEEKMVQQYIDNLNNIYPDYCIYLTKNKNTILTDFPSKITFVYEVFDTSIFEQLPNTDFSLLNTEPLNIPYRLQSIKNIQKLYNGYGLGYYDYSKSNLHILNENAIDFKYKIHLPYICSSSELLQLQKINKDTEKIFDFGTIKASGGYVSPRRQQVVNFLKSNHFSVNIIEGWNNDRDNELAKCKIILNIHGNLNDDVSMIFEHLRCDRLLAAGYKILSENCLYLDEEFINKNKEKLKLIKYDEFFNINTYNNLEWLKLKNMDRFSLSNDDNNTNIEQKNYCFIHSCNLENVGTGRLEYLIKRIEESKCINILEKIYINNIGIPIKENIYGNKFNICNYSDNPKLYEIPTINKIHQFSKENTNCNILYLHTKGISYDDNDQKENDWIDMMLYFLVEKFDLCLEKLQQGIQAVGCNYNYKNNPAHFSGNFWWSESQYISKLPSLIEKTENVNPNDAEFWLCKNNPSIYVLHNSKINHYHNEYPKKNYCKNYDLVIQSKSELVINKLSNTYSSAWLGHMKFAFFIVNLLKPSVIVDLGVDFGHSTFSFASAQQGTVFGIDSFEGDIQSGIKNTLNIVNKLKNDLVLQDLLIDNIKFIKGYFDDIFNHFDQTIDILHIDGLHTIEAVSNDYNKWITKTSDNAVILFHDVMSYPDSVGKVFNDIQYPKFYFTHSAGLGVVCKTQKLLNFILSNTELPNKEYIIYNKPKNTEKIKIIDCFIFYNELDMLTYRLNILNDVVDYFVLVESTHTFVGKEKSLFYQENKHLFEKFNNKIIHIIVDDFPHKYPNIDFEKQEQWNNEKFQRNCISRGIHKLNLNSTDIITILDLDEIPNPNILTQMKTNDIAVSINILQMDFYYYNLNSKMDHKWNHSKILTFEKYNKLNIDCENIRFYSCPIINNGGWHLSYFGDNNFIKNKIENFSHQELNLELFTNQEKIQNRIKNKQDLFDRDIKIYHINIEDNDNLPPSYDVYLRKYYTNCRNYMNNYKYTQTWFLDSEIKNNLSNFLDKSKENKILEIGCFEGLSSVFFADNFLDNPKSSLTCVDPFLTINNNDHSQFLQNNEEMNFDFNISICENSDRITKHKITSDIFFENNNQTYNFVYIDGCHEPEFIKRDMENSFNILEKNGIMWMDDYSGGDGIQIKNAMNTFLEKYNGQYVLIHMGYQLAIRKC